MPAVDKTVKEKTGERRAFKLSARLQACVELLPAKSKRLIDVGCDHGLLAVRALQMGKCETVLAIDIEEGPLARAALAFRKHQLGSCTRLFLNDGLQGVALQENDSIVIAGMGGLEICDILSNCSYDSYLSSGLRAEGLHLVVQPMKSQALFRLFMAVQGFSLVEERLVKERRRIYLQAAYKFPPQALVGNIKEQLLYERDERRLRSLRALSKMSIADALFGTRLAEQYALSGLAGLSVVERSYVLTQMKMLADLQATHAVINGLGRVSELVKSNIFKRE